MSSQASAGVCQAGRQHPVSYCIFTYLLCLARCLPSLPHKIPALILYRGTKRVGSVREAGTLLLSSTGKDGTSSLLADSNVPALTSSEVSVRRYFVLFRFLSYRPILCLSLSLSFHLSCYLSQRNYSYLTPKSLWLPNLSNSLEIKG